MTSLRSATAVLGAAAAAAVALAVAPAAAQEPGGLVETEISVQGAGREFGATVIAPEGAEGLPGLVLVAGSGPGERDRYRAHAEVFAEAGVAVLLYDKRGADEGYSYTSASIEDLADDAVAAVEALQERPEADPDLVGLHGHSEGAWVVIEAAARSTAPAFVVTSGGSALPPEDTQAWMNRESLHDAGVSERLLDPLGRQFIAALVADDLFRLSGYDPLPALAGIDRPFLGVFAEHDVNTAPGTSFALYEETLREAGNPNFALRVIPGVDHGMVASEDGSHGEDYDEDALDQTYVDTVADWIHGLARGESAVVVDAAPGQDVEATAVPEAPWYGTATATLAALVLFTVLFGAYPIAALVRRLRGRPGMEATWASRTVAVFGPIVPLVVFVYAAWMLMSGGTELLGPVVAGRPVPWLVIEAAAVLVVAAAIALAVQARRGRARIDRASKARFAALLAGVAVLIPWGAYWGLIV
ncbi:alpha/beta hydrolase family protein [Glycomyces paridis]|uniref:Peptidase S9 prolyl oligopeptidase catalytic domain-containing protein n=1 Tax=Glycomyces paridis TaxID=2126555 RepID=A0A4S8PEE2_9ACTN|nr:prolyl oligopeptidase family serine peptidase [Glycomyces paridis]THV28737.1 hypothetical protein E9998_11590 [Glycomyces paridis]